MSLHGGIQYRLARMEDIPEVLKLLELVHEKDHKNFMFHQTEASLAHMVSQSGLVVAVDDSGAIVGTTRNEVCRDKETIQTAAENCWGMFDSSAPVLLSGRYSISSTSVDDPTFESDPSVAEAMLLKGAADLKSPGKTFIYCGTVSSIPKLRRTTVASSVYAFASRNAARVLNNIGEGRWTRLGLKEVRMIGIVAIGPGNPAMRKVTLLGALNLVRELLALIGYNKNVQLNIEAVIRKQEERGNLPAFELLEYRWVIPSFLFDVPKSKL